MSGFFSKIVTSLRNGEGELGASYVDRNTIRSYAQKLDDEKNNLSTTKKNLAHVVTKIMRRSREIDRIKLEIKKYEETAVEAINSKNQVVLEEMAEKVAELEQEMAAQHSLKDQYSGHAKRLKDLMKKSENTIRALERELVMVKTTESVQKATKSIAQCYSSGTNTLLDAKNSLARIRQRQINSENRWAAEEKLVKDLEDHSLDQKQHRAEIIDTKLTKNAVLERIRKRASE